VAVAVVVVAVFMHALSDLCVVGSATTVRLSRAKSSTRGVALVAQKVRACTPDGAASCRVCPLQVAVQL
jgi:hypothetical protein